ncbi:MAG: ABC transporter ATP-binding protein/permease [Oscillospiraceae bacterium]|jgi:ATP-binding cassette subfamily B protein|nr:ABC transporter ATP-binding protein/permease [Oscillospiraceae bacterium]
MSYKPKQYTAISNMLFCLKCTAGYIPSLLLWVAFSVFVKVAIPVLEMYIPKIILTEITAGKSWQGLVIVVLIFTLSLAFLGAFSKFCERCIYDKKNMIGRYYIRLISHKALTTDYANRESENFRTLQEESYQMCQSNESTLRNIYYVWISFFAGVFGFAFYSAILTQINIIILLFLISTTTASYFIGLRVTKWSDNNSAERAKYHHKLGYIDAAAEDIKSAKDIRLYNMEGWLQRIYSDNIEKIAAWYKRYDRLVLKTTLANSGVSLLREGIAYGYLIYLAINGQIGVGDFVLYFAAITGFSGWLGNIIGQLTEMKRISIYVSKIRSYLDYPEIFKRERGISTDEKLYSPCRIELKNVRYRYLGAEVDALRNINLIIEKGEHIGIVGLNGAGKTTLVKLICGLVDPTEGEVLYDGVNIREYNRVEFYRLFSAVFQQYSLLSLSINEVVAEAQADKVDAARVEGCLKTAGLWDKVSSLPHGTKSLYDKGVNDDAVVFSGGETQKLLLARAIYKNAPVLILDEPTAALDPIAEHKLYDDYHNITSGKTSVFVSHRLASTRFCDRIILINGGSIEEAGTHTKLLQNKGLYFNLFETQAKYYRENAESEAALNEEN